MLDFMALFTSNKATDNVIFSLPIIRLGLQQCIKLGCQPIAALRILKTCMCYSFFLLSQAPYMGNTHEISDWAEEQASAVRNHQKRERDVKLQSKISKADCFKKIHVAILLDDS